MKILFLHNGSDLYGASRSLIRLTTRLVRDHHTVTVVLPANGPLLDALLQNGVNCLIQPRMAIIDRPTFKSLRKLILLVYNFFNSTFWLFKLAGEIKPNIIHSNCSVILTGALAAKIRKIPHIWHIRDSFQEFGLAWIFYQYYLYAFSDAIICVSGAMADQFSKNISRQKIHVIHNGFPIDEFRPVDAERIQTYKQSILDKDAELLIGIVGRIKFVRKGQEIFVKAAARLHERYPNIKFLCIGSPYPGNEIHLANLENLIRQFDLENYVICTGEAKDIKAAISALDILVMASVQPEPFGGVVIEAMAFGKPVVATRCGGNTEQVVDGETGYLVTPGDSQEMAEAIEALINDPGKRLQLGEAGRQRFLSNFEFTEFYAKISSLYQTFVQ